AALFQCVCAPPSIMLRPPPSTLCPYTTLFRSTSSRPGPGDDVASGSSLRCRSGRGDRALLIERPHEIRDDRVEIVPVFQEAVVPVRRIDQRVGDVLAPIADAACEQLDVVRREEPVG